MDSADSIQEKQSLDASRRQENIQSLNSYIWIKNNNY